jgi:molecular chaperone GrpE
MDDEGTSKAFGVKRKMAEQKKSKTSNNTTVKARESGEEVDNSSVVVLTGKDILSEEDDLYKTRYLYLQADFENYKKRMTKQMNDTVKWANEKLVTSLLPMIDDFERAVNAGKASQDIGVLISGMEILLNNFKKALREAGVTEINAMGQQFNPLIHEAIDRVETLEDEEGTILEELRKGYLFHDHCIRPSMVRVAVRPPEEIDKISSKEVK